MSELSFQEQAASLTENFRAFVLNQSSRCIFIQLCAAGIPLGIFPSQDLLDLFQVDQYFAPVILAMKAGDAVALNLALNSWDAMSWFLKQWIHAVLKEKCIVLLWRNLVRRTCVSYTSLSHL